MNLDIQTVWHIASFFAKLKMMKWLQMLVPSLSLKKWELFLHFITLNNITLRYKLSWYDFRQYEYRWFDLCIFIPLSASSNGCTQTIDFMRMKERVLPLCQHYFAWFDYTIVSFRSFWFMTLESQTFWQVASLFRNDEMIKWLQMLTTFWVGRSGS